MVFQKHFFQGLEKVELDVPEVGKIYNAAGETSKGKF